MVEETDSASGMDIDVDTLSRNEMALTPQKDKRDGSAAPYSNPAPQATTNDAPNVKSEDQIHGIEIFSGYNTGGDSVPKIMSHSEQHQDQDLSTVNGSNDNPFVMDPPVDHYPTPGGNDTTLEERVSTALQQENHSGPEALVDHNASTGAPAGDGSLANDQFVSFAGEESYTIQEEFQPSGETVEPSEGNSEAHAANEFLADGQLASYATEENYTLQEEIQPGSEATVDDNASPGDHVDDSSAADDHLVSFATEESYSLPLQDKTQASPQTTVDDNASPGNYVDDSSLADDQFLPFAMEESYTLPLQEDTLTDLEAIGDHNASSEYQADEECLADHQSDGPIEDDSHWQPTTGTENNPIDLESSDDGSNAPPREVGPIEISCLHGESDTAPMDVDTIDLSSSEDESDIAPMEVDPIELSSSDVEEFDSDKPTEDNISVTESHVEDQSAFVTVDYELSDSISDDESHSDSDPEMQDISVPSPQAEDLTSSFVVEDDADVMDEGDLSRAISDDGTTPDPMSGIEGQDDGDRPEDTEDPSLDEGIEEDKGNQEVEDTSMSIEPPSNSVTQILNVTAIGPKPKKEGPFCDPARHIHILRCGHPVLATQPAEDKPCAKNCAGINRGDDVGEHFGCRLCYRLKQGYVKSWYLSRLDDLLLEHHIPKDEDKEIQKSRLTDIIFLEGHSAVFPRGIRAPRQRGMLDFLTDRIRHEEREFPATEATIMPANSLEEKSRIRKAITAMAMNEHRLAKQAEEKTKPPLRFDAERKEELRGLIAGMCNHWEHKAAPWKDPGWGGKHTSCYLFDLVGCGEKFPDAPLDVVMAACIVMGFGRYKSELSGCPTADKLGGHLRCSVEEIDDMEQRVQAMVLARAVNSAGHIPRSFKRTAIQQGVLEWLADTKWKLGV
jgi:hypothetical protein